MAGDSSDCREFKWTLKDGYTLNELLREVRFRHKREEKEERIWWKRRK